MTSSSAFNPSTDITFVVKNNSSIHRSIKVFNNAIGPGNTLDLMKIPGITEEDIRTEVTKGSLRNLLAGGSLQVLTSTVNFSTADAVHGGFLKSVGISSSTSSASTLSQASWYIDANNGSDVNDGYSSGAALKTFAELKRRLGLYSTLVGGAYSDVNYGTAKITTVNILSTLPNTDPFDLQVTLGLGSWLVVLGTPTTLYSGTLTSVTAGPTTSGVGSNNTWTITVTGVNWATYIGKRCRITSGPNVGTVFWIAKDLGSNTARISTPNYLDLDHMPIGFASLMSGPASTTQIQTGDAFVIEDLPKVTWGNVDVRSQIGGNDTDAVNQARFGMAGVELKTAGSSNSNDGAVVTVGNVVTVFKGCKFSTNAIVEPHSGSTVYNATSGGFDMAVSFSGCCFDNPLSNWNAKFLGKEVGFNAGLSLNGTILVGEGTLMNVNGFFLCQGNGTMPPVIVHGTLRAQALSVFDSSTHGIVVGERRNSMTGRLWLAPLSGGTAGYLLGSGNAGVGVLVCSGTQMGYGASINQSLANIFLTGSLGDFRLGNASTARPFSEVDGYYGAPVTTDGTPGAGWAALNSAGSLHNVQQNAHAIKLTDVLL